RHTRWPRDWSSDVCSSDLPRGPPAIVARRYRRDDHHTWRAWPEFPHLKSVRTARVDRCDLPDGLCRFICDQPRADLLALNRRDRSEERRVGKETEAVLPAA